MISKEIMLPMLMKLYNMPTNVSKKVTLISGNVWITSTQLVLLTKTMPKNNKKKMLDYKISTN